MKKILIALCFCLAVVEGAASASAHGTEPVSDTHEIEDAIETLTNELSGAVPATIRASTPSRASIAKRRKALMAELAEKNPARFLELVIPASVRNELLRDVQTLIETPTRAQGTITIFHHDDFANPEQSRFERRLETADATYVLAVGGESDVATGDTVAVEGYAIGTTIVADTAAVSVKQRAPRPETVGPQRILAIPLVFPAMTTVRPLTKNQIHQLLFEGPLQQYYSEQSYGKAPLAGTVTDWLTMPSSVSAGGCTSVNLNTPAITDHLKSQGIDMSRYHHVVFLIAGYGGGCGVVGRSSQYLADGTGPYRVSTSWIGVPTNIEKGKYELRADDAVVPTRFGTTYEEYAYTHCTAYAKANPTLTVSCTWNGVTIFDSTAPDMWRRGLSRLSYAIAHELGHGLGLMHSNSLECPGNTYYDPQCRHIEYGNDFDVMGSGLIRYVDGDIFGYGGHFTAYSKILLGWLPNASILPVTTTGNYTLAALESGSGVRALKVANPLAPDHPLYVELRQPIGYDRDLPPQSAGLMINELPRLYYTPLVAPRLLNANQVRNPAFTQPALTRGGIFRDSSRGITISSTTIASGTAQFRVAFSKPVCEVTDPDIGSRQDVIEAYAGYENEFSVLVANLDTPGCGNSSFAFTASTTSKGLRRFSVDPLPVTVIPGDTEIVSIRFYVATTTRAGLHDVMLTVKDTAHNRTFTLTQQIQVIRPDSFVSAVSAEAPSESATPRSTLRILSPNGGEILNFGQPTMITWEGAGISSTTLILMRNGARVKPIARGVEESEFLWTPRIAGIDLTLGDQFTVLVRGIRLDTGKILTDQSDATFTLAR